jgi:hypothetical protein
MSVTSPCEPQIIDAVSPRRAVTVPRRRTGGGERGDVAEGLKAWRWEGRTRGVWSDILFRVRFSGWSRGVVERCGAKREFGWYRRLK